jgi:hypothetical protein
LWNIDAAVGDPAHATGFAIATNPASATTACDIASAALR